MTEAKNEVMERKRDLDMTKEKMDKLVDKLYLGRQAHFASNSSPQTADLLSGLVDWPRWLCGHVKHMNTQNDNCLARCDQDCCPGC